MTLKTKKHKGIELINKQLKRIVCKNLEWICLKEACYAKRSLEFCIDYQDGYSLSLEFWYIDVKVNNISILNDLVNFDWIVT